jgi:NADH-quinone oxidoreductase subunit C
MDALLSNLGALYMAKCDQAKTGKSWQVFLPAASIVTAAKRLLAAEWHLEDVFALDCVEGYIVTYHFAHFEAPGRVAIRVVVPHDKPALPSIAGVYQGAEWHERETRDFHGVIFEGNPNFVPLLISPDMADCFPLRKGEKARNKAKVILEAGEVIFCAPGFEIMTPDAPPAGAASAVDKPATA